MYKNETKEKGDEGLGFVIADLFSNQIQVALPISEHLPFDCIAISANGKLKRISVKYRKIAKHGAIAVPLRSAWSNSSGCHVKEYNLSEFDVVAIYCPESKKCYYMRIDEIKTKTITLHVEEPKQKQKTIIYAKDFENANRIFKE